MKMRELQLTLRDDGTLTVIGASGQPLWSSGHTVSRMVQAAARETAPAPLSRSTGWANVGNKKSMNTSATLYTNVLLAVVVDLKNGDWWTGLRGEIVVVGVDAIGSAVWVTNPEISCPTCCAVQIPLRKQPALAGTDTAVARRCRSNHCRFRHLPRGCSKLPRRCRRNARSDLQVRPRASGDGRPDD